MAYLPKDVAKPASRSVNFAPGTSSATLTGNHIALGFEDRFNFVAVARQTLTLTLIKRDAHFGSFSVLRDGAAIASAQRGSLVVKLPASGTYYVVVEGRDESFSAYALSVTIH